MEMGAPPEALQTDVPERTPPRRGWRLDALPTFIRSLAGALATAAVLALVVALVDAAGSPPVKQAALNGVTYMVIAIGLQTFMGLSGVVSFGHIGFVAIGAYVAALCTTPPDLKPTVIPRAPEFVHEVSLPFVPGTLVAVGVTALVALIVGVVFVRMSPAAAPLATLGFLLVVSVVGTNLTSITNGAQSFFGIPESTTLWSGLGFATVVLVVSRLFRDSAWGLALRASRNDELAARASGVLVERARLLAWVLSAGIAAVGGSLYAHSLGAIAPSVFLFGLTFVVLTIVVVGGQSTSAAVVGAVVMTVVTEGIRQLTGDASAGGRDLAVLTTIVPGVLVLLVLIKRPQGLLGRWEAEEVVARAFHGRKQR